nr:HupE/UreJ family protein [Rhodovulum sp. P5]
MAGTAGLPLPRVETGIALSVIVLGAAIAAEWRPWEWVTLAIVAVFAIFHGYAHGAELPRAADPANYATGFVLATGMIHVLGIGVGLLLNPIWQGRLSRLLGAAIALAGVGFLVL